MADDSYNFLGTSGVKVSNMCLGTMTFGESYFGLPNNLNEDDSHKVMNRFLQLGGNFIDTANMYGLGQSEQIVGTWLERQERHNFVVATKVRFHMGGDEKNKNNVGLSRRHITQSIDESLKRLHTDFVDLYQTHCWDDGTCIDETLRTLDDLVRCGKVRYVGVSNVYGWQLERIVRRSQALGLCPITSLQQQYNLLERVSEFEPFQVCKTEGIAVLPWSPLRGGMLTGKLRRNPTKTISGSRASVFYEHEMKMKAASLSQDSFFDTIEAAEAIAKEIGRSPAQVSLRWLLQKDLVSSVIIGATKLEQLEDNMAAASGWKLTDEQMKRLDDVSQQNLPYPYNNMWGMQNGRSNPFLPQYVKNEPTASPLEGPAET